MVAVLWAVAPTAARAGPAGPAPGPPTPELTTYTWPLPPVPVVEAPFREPTHRYGPGHRGVDLAAEAGTPVRAAAAGTVVFAGVLAGRGVVSVQHPDGLRTTYEPVAAVVTAGTPVVAGAPLGTVVTGHRGCRATCLHWGARRDRGTYLDPLLLVVPRRVRLLPLPAPVMPGDEPARGPP